MKESIDHIRQLLFVIGLSGAGKSSVAKLLSDQGFFTIENLPVPLVRDFLEFSKRTPDRFARTAILLDIASRERVIEFNTLLDSMDLSAGPVKLLYIDCQTTAIVKRYSETRRPHPEFEAERDRTIEDSIERERARLAPLRDRSNFTIDTSDFTIHQLRREMQTFLTRLEGGPDKKVHVNFLSFGFRHGVPAACDLVLDVRFLPNPYFVTELKERTGLESDVADYVLQSTDAQDFLTKTKDLLQFLLPRYSNEGKSYVTIGIGCTGGKHRSVAITEDLAKSVSNMERRMVFSVKHRDIEK